MSTVSQFGEARAVTRFLGSRPGDPSTVAAARQVIAWFFGPVIQRWFTVRYWDGTSDIPPLSIPVFVLVIRSPESLRRMFCPATELRLAEAFVHGDFDVEGDLEQAAALADTLRARAAASPLTSYLMNSILALIGTGRRSTAVERRSHGNRLLRHSRTRDAAAIRAHYDVGNDFYALWLDRKLVYSCAYFPTGTEDINEAQEAKLGHICRKLRLERGERVLDVGCGWGALISYAAERFGVHTTGVTVSPAQAGYARDLIERHNLSHRCTVELLDYRDIDETDSYDKVTSVGMFEHVGATKLDAYFRKIFRVLRPGGLFLNHGIITPPLADDGSLAARIARMRWRHGEFMDRYVFPDGELVTLDRAIRSAERAGFEVRDVESLREHYALTLRRWVGRLEASADAAIALVGEETYRVWRLYMAGSANAFATRQMGVVQLLLAKPDARGRVTVPLTRQDIYA